jgi:hypothetical protein
MFLHVLQGLRLRFAKSFQDDGEQERHFHEFEKETDLLVETVLYGMIKRIEH